MTFVESNISSGSYIAEHAMAGESLAFDALNFTVIEENPRIDFGTVLETSDGKDFTTLGGATFTCLSSVPFTEFIPGTPVLFYQDEKLVNKFYLSDVKRTGIASYRFECESAIGLLDKSYHPGGIYTGTSITTLLDEILAGIDYELNPIASNIKLYGWLPYATKRENLQQITIATALSIKVKTDGKLYITALSSDVKASYTAGKMFPGGNVEVGSPATALQVTEHQFIEDTAEITLCDESFFTTKLIIFSEPVHSLTISGGTIVNSSANHATVTGSGAVLLKGKKYIHTTKQVTQGTILGSSKDNIMEIKDATLITSLNSNAVAQKLYEALIKPTAIVARVLKGDERAGDVVEILNPYSEILETGFVTKVSADIATSPIAEVKVLVDYTPSGVITGYKNRVLLTSGVSWTVPAGVTEIRAILIGGGEGGQAGFKGKIGMPGGDFPQQSSKIADDNVSPWLLSYNGDAGDGGNGGEAGQGGKIVDTGPIAVTPGEVKNITIGAVGTGGEENGAVGDAGGDTIFDTYSSANGEVSDTGYVDIMTSAVYGSKGYPGFKGQMGVGKNNLPSPTALDRIRKDYNASGYTNDWWYTGWIADIAPNTLWVYYGGSGNYSYAIAGGPGGSSRNGTGGSSQGADWSDNNGKGFLDGGKGGDGADGGSPSSQSVYGAGGYGGHGGGGGGGGGAAKNWWASPPGGGYYYSHGAGGKGGAGGPGGNGKQGCIIIYY